MANDLSNILAQKRKNWFNKYFGCIGDFGLVILTIRIVFWFYWTNVRPLH